MPELFGWIGGPRSPLTALPTGPGAFADAPAQQIGDRAADGTSGLVVCDPGLAERSDCGHASDPRGRQVAYLGRPAFADPARQARAASVGLARALLEAYDARAESLPAGLTGQFALALIDPTAGRVLLAVDRMGVHQLAYAEAAGGIAFATDLNLLARHPGVDTAIGPQAVYRYACNYVSPAPETIYAGVRKLLAAQMLDWRGGRTSTAIYWRAPAPGSVRGSRAELAEQLHRRLEAGVAGALKASGARRPGAFLSGGLDSSVVAGLLARLRGTATPAFTISFDDPRYDETAYAAIAAGHFGLEHHTYRLTPADAVDLVPQLAAACDEPFGNSSLLPAFACARMAREAGVDLLLAGDGGDELFAGNQRYVEQQVLDLYGRVPKPLRTGLSAVLGALPARLAVSWLGKAQRYVARAAQPMPGRMLANGVYHPAALAGIFTADALAEIDAGAPEAAWTRHFEAAGTDDLVHAMQRLDWRVTLADNDLRKVERAGRTAGIEVAYPMLDAGLVAFAAGLPSDLLIQRFRLRAFFKDAMAGFLPEPILAKPKHGFGMPFSEWTRSDPGLWSLVVDAFAGLKTRKLFRADFLDTVLRAHAADGDPDLSAIVWDLLMLEAWWQARETQPAQAAHPEDRCAPVRGAGQLPEAI